MKWIWFQIDDTNDPDQNLLCSPISVFEITKICQILKRKKAPGPDGIPYEFLRFGPPSLFLALATLFNASFQTGFLPSAWKDVTLHMLPKENTDLSNPSSYRPIALYSTIAKLMERILTRRLTIFLENKKLIPPDQAAFRKSRSTPDQKPWP